MISRTPRTRADAPLGAPALPTPAVEAISAAALIGSEDIGDTLNGAQSLALALREANQMLCAESVCPATCAIRARRPRLM